MIDTESGETAPLKPTTGQKTRGLYVLARDVDEYFEKSGAVSKSQIQASHTRPVAARVSP